MNSNNTLLFPDTYIFKAKIYPLLLFSTPLHFLQLVEGGIKTAIHDESSYFLDAGLCKAHTPADLADKKTIFLRFIQHAKEYSQEQLFDVLKNNQNEKDIAPGIIASLLDISERELVASNADFKLLRAGLILAISEILDFEQEDLYEQLLSIDKHEAVGFEALKEEQNQQVQSLMDDIEKVKKQLDKHHIKNNKLRFDAWLRLLRRQQVPSVKIWLTTSRMSAEHVFQRYKQTKAVPSRC